MTRIGDETVSSFSHGRTSGVGTAAVALSSSATQLAKGVQVRAADDNAAVVYVGMATLTTDTADATDGYPLAAGETLFLPVSDMRKVYLRATTAGQKVFWVAL